MAKARGRSRSLHVKRTQPIELDQAFSRLRFTAGDGSNRHRVPGEGSSAGYMEYRSSGGGVTVTEAVDRECTEGKEVDTRRIFAPARRAGPPFKPGDIIGHS
jgi:hypothetical protein